MTDLSHRSADQRDDRPAGTRSIEALTDDFRGRDYIADRSLATAVFLALELERPLLLEGEAGVGKTELAKVLAASLEIGVSTYDDVHRSARRASTPFKYISTSSS